MQAVVSSNYNSAQNAFIQHFETEASFKQWASFSSVSYSSFGDIRMGKTVNTATKTGAWSIPILLIAKQHTLRHPAPIAILTFKKTVATAKWISSKNL